jgi:tripartite-type tricarboxylate transporter receptor subunit TctC
MRLLSWLAAAALAISATTVAMAQADFPKRAIKIIAPIPAGSSADLLARIYANGLQDKWGVSVVVENRVGASHNIGADAAWRAPPDGYTLLTAPPPSLALNKYLFPKLAYDPDTFVPVTVMAEVPNVLVVRPGLDVADIKALIALAKSKPGQLSYGSTGKGSTLQLSAEAFRNQAGVEFLHVPFTGVPQMISEMLAGRVDITFAPLIDLYPYISAGSLKALGVGADDPSPELPGVPTIAATLPGYHATAWFAVAAPPKTPPELVEKLSAAIREAFQQPDGAKAFQNLHAKPILNKPAEAAAFIKADSLRWKKVIETNNIVGE